MQSNTTPIQALAMHVQAMRIQHGWHSHKADDAVIELVNAIVRPSGRSDLPQPSIVVDPGTLVRFGQLGIQVRADYNKPEFGRQPFVTVNTEELDPAHLYGETGTPAIAVHLNDNTLYDDEGQGNRQRSDTCLPDDLSVYVVRPDDPSEDVAVFMREEDAEAFAATYDDSSPAGDIERCVVADPGTARKMVDQRIEELDPDDENGLTRPAGSYNVGDRVSAPAGSGIVSDVSWSPTRGEWGYTVNEPEDGRRPVVVYESEVKSDAYMPPRDWQTGDEVEKHGIKGEIAEVLGRGLSQKLSITWDGDYEDSILSPSEPTLTWTGRNRKEA